MSFYFRDRNRNRHCFERNPLNRQRPNFAASHTQPMIHYHTACQTPPSSFKSRDGTKWTFLYEEILNQEEIQRVPSLAERFAEKQTEGVYGDLYIKEETCFEEADPMFVEDLVNEIVMINGVYRWYRTLSRTSYTRRIFRKYRKRFVYGRADNIPSTASSVESNQKPYVNEGPTNIQRLYQESLQFSQPVKDDLTTTKRSSSDMSANETDSDHIIFEPTTKRYITEIRLPGKQERFKTEIENKISDFEYDNQLPVMRGAPTLLRGQRSVQLLCETNNNEQRTEQNKLYETGLPLKNKSMTDDDLQQQCKSNDISIGKSLFDTYGQITMGIRPTSTCADQAHLFETRLDEQIFTDYTNQINIMDSGFPKHRNSQQTTAIYTDGTNTELYGGDKTNLWKINESDKLKRRHLSKNSDEIPHEIPRSWLDETVTESKSSDIRLLEERPDVVNFVSTFTDRCLNKNAHKLQEKLASARYSLPCKTINANDGHEVSDLSRDIIDNGIETHRSDILMKTQSLDNVIEWHLQIPSTMDASSDEKYQVNIESSNPLSTDTTMNPLSTGSCLNQLINWHTQTNEGSFMLDRDPKTSLDNDGIVPISDDSGIVSSNVWSTDNYYEIVPNDARMSLSDKAHTESDISHIPVEDIIDWHIQQIPHPQSEQVANEDIESAQAEFKKSTKIDDMNDAVALSDSSMAVSTCDDAGLIFTSLQKECESVEDTYTPMLQQRTIPNIINWHLQLRPAFPQVVGKVSDEQKVLSDGQPTGDTQNIHGADDINLTVKLDKYPETNIKESKLTHEDDREITPALFPVQLETSVKIETNQYFDTLYPCGEDGNQTAIHVEQSIDNKAMNVDRKSSACFQNEQLGRYDDAEKLANDQVQATTFTDESSNYPASTDIGQRLKPIQNNEKHDILGKNVGQLVDSECESKQSIKCPHSPTFYDATNKCIEDLNVKSQPVEIQTKDYVPVCEQTVRISDHTNISDKELTESLGTYPALLWQAMEIGESVKTPNYTGISKDHSISFNENDKTRMSTHDIKTEGVNSREIPDYIEELYRLPNLKILETFTEKCNDEDDKLQKNGIQVCDQTKTSDVEAQCPLTCTDSRKVDHVDKQDNHDKEMTKESIKSIIKWHFLPKQVQFVETQRGRGNSDLSAQSKDNFPSKYIANKLTSISDIVNWHLNPLRRKPSALVEDSTKSPGITRAEQIAVDTYANDQSQTADSLVVPWSISAPIEAAIASATSSESCYVDPKHDRKEHLNKIENVFSNVRAVEKLLPCGQATHLRNDETFAQKVDDTDDKIIDENKDKIISGDLANSDEIPGTISYASSSDTYTAHQPHILGLSNHLPTAKSQESMLAVENAAIRFNSSHYYALFRTSFHRKLLNFLTMQHKNLAIDRSSSSDEIFLLQTWPDQTGGCLPNNIEKAPQLIAKESLFDLLPIRATTNTEIKSLAVDASLELPGHHVPHLDNANFVPCICDPNICGDADANLISSQFVIPPSDLGDGETAPQINDLRTADQSIERRIAISTIAQIPMTARHFHSVQKHDFLRSPNVMCNSHQNDDKTMMGAIKEPVLCSYLSDAKESLANSVKATEILFESQHRSLPTCNDIIKNMENYPHSDIHKDVNFEEFGNESVSLPMTSRHYYAVQKGNLHGSYTMIVEKSSHLEPSEMANDAISIGQIMTIDKHGPIDDLSTLNVDNFVIHENREAVSSILSNRRPSIDLPDVTHDRKNLEAITEDTSSQKDDKKETFNDFKQIIDSSLYTGQEYEVDFPGEIVQLLNTETPKSSQEIECRDFEQPTLEGTSVKANDKEGIDVQHIDLHGSFEACTKEHGNADEICVISLNRKQLDSSPTSSPIENVSIEIDDISLEDKAIVDSNSNLDVVNKIKHEPIKNQILQSICSAQETDGNNSELPIQSSKDNALKSLFEMDSQSKKHELIIPAVPTDITNANDKVKSNEIKLSKESNEISAASKKCKYGVPEVPDVMNIALIRLMDIPAHEPKKLTQPGGALKRFHFGEYSLGVASILQGFRECLRKRLGAHPIRQADKVINHVRDTSLEFSSLSDTFEANYNLMAASPIQQDTKDDNNLPKCMSTEYDTNIESVVTIQKTPISSSAAGDETQADTVSKNGSLIFRSRQDVDQMTSSSDISTTSTWTNEEMLNEKCPKSNNIRRILCQHASLTGRKTELTRINISDLHSHSGSKFSGIVHIMNGFKERINSAAASKEKLKSVIAAQNYKTPLSGDDFPSCLFGAELECQSSVVEDVQRYFDIQNKQALCLDSMISADDTAQGKEITDEHRHSRRSLIEYFKDARETVDYGKTIDATGFDPSFFNCERIDHIEPSSTGLDMSDIDVASIRNKIMTMTDEPWQIIPPNKEENSERDEQSEERTLIKVSDAYDNIIKNTAHLAEAVVCDAPVTKQLSRDVDLSQESSNLQITRDKWGSQTCLKHIENQARLSEANARLLHESCADQLTTSQMTTKEPVCQATVVPSVKIFRSKLPVPTERVFDAKGKLPKIAAANHNYASTIMQGELKTRNVVEPIETLLHRGDKLNKRLDRDGNYLRELKDDLTKHFTPTLLTDYEPRLAMCAKQDDDNSSDGVIADVTLSAGKSIKPNGKNMKSVFYGAKGCDEKLKESLKRLKLSQPDFVRKYHHWTDCDSEVGKQAIEDSLGANDIPRLPGEPTEESDTVFDTLVCKLQTDGSPTSPRFPISTDTSSSNESLTSIRQRR